ncbi:MAG: adenosylmethionine--8-amino-7-oxononanoate transaminase [Nitrospirae bacterium]|nr:adenosylmethionine--8-amino-7-oxononanoate transaminase [Nitrospirota bacterium]MBF0556009.1 adenosylmethionine--8-amino-7-oxononanoate transaminase [Nitrospirota bacterium]
MSYPDEIKHLQESDREYIWHPFTQMKGWLEEDQIIIAEGRDCFLKDVYGKWYLDGVSSLWVNIHGHRKKEIDDSIRDQLGKIAHSTLLGLGNVPSIRLAEKLSGIAPKALCKVFYSDNGSTAVEVALKMAYQYWVHKGESGRNSFLSLKYGYHGDTLGAVSVGGIDIFHAAFGPLLFKTYKAPAPYCYRCEFGKTGGSCGQECLHELENIMGKHAAGIAAVIIEPLVQAAGGMIVWPEGYLKGVRALCDRYNVLLIADEVATGFGRTGKMFACEHEAVVPDIMCISKGLTNGYLPLAVTLATKEIFNAFLGEFSELKTFFHGHSYTGNPLACAAALASIGIFEKEHTLQNMTDTIALLESELADVSELPHVGDVRNKGLMAGIELVRDKSSGEPYAWEEKVGWRVAYKAREEGVLIRPLGNVIVIMPPLSISVELLKRLMGVIKKSIAAATNS